LGQPAAAVTPLGIHVRRSQPSQALCIPPAPTRTRYEHAACAQQTRTDER